VQWTVGAIKPLHQGKNEGNLPGKEGPQKGESITVGQGKTAFLHECKLGSVTLDSGWIGTFEHSLLCTLLGYCLSLLKSVGAVWLNQWFTYITIHTA
jgi:hypothetical protein